MTRRRVTVVMNCPDERWFHPRPFKPWDDGAVVFGYHGLIAPRHGLVEAVEALHALRREVPAARLLLLGGGDGLAAVRDRVAELGLGDAVSLPDAPVPVPKVIDELNTVHIGLLPSRRDAWTNEVLPTKLLEYATMGIPVITFRNRVIERFFPEDSVTYVDPASPENLHAAMRALVRDPRRARAQAAAANAVMAGLTWERQKEAYFGVIDRMTTPRRRAFPRQRRPGRAEGAIHGRHPDGADQPALDRE